MHSLSYGYHGCPRHVGLSMIGSLSMSSVSPQPVRRSWQPGWKTTQPKISCSQTEEEVETRRWQRRETKDGNGKKQKEAEDAKGQRLTTLGNQFSKKQRQRTSLRNPGVDAEPIWEVNAASISHGRKQSYYGKSMLLAYPTANSNRHETKTRGNRSVTYHSEAISLVRSKSSGHP